MKKIFLLLLILLAIESSAEIKIETVREIEAERSMASWIESILEPIIGETIVIANLTLKYPSSKLEVYGSTLDKSKSLPGLPIAKSKSVMPTSIDEEETYPTRIVKKEITVYVKEKLAEDMKDFLIQNITLWLDLNPEKGDQLNIQNIQTVSSNISKSTEKTDFFLNQNIFIIFGLILLLLIFLFIVMFLLGMNNLSKAVKNISISDIGKVLRVKGNLGYNVSNVEKKPSFNSSKPIPIRIISDKKENDMTDLDYLETMSLPGFYDLLQTLTDQEKIFVLMNISEDLASRYFKQYPAIRKKILPQMLSKKTIPQQNIKHLYKKLSLKFADIEKDEKNVYNSTKKIIKILNSLNDEDAQKILAEIEAEDSSSYVEIRKKVLLSEDIPTLSSEQIECVLQKADYSELAKFLKISTDDLNKRFLSILTPRAKAILSEEIEFLDSISEIEKSDIKCEMLMKFREILGYLKD